MPSSRIYFQASSVESRALKDIQKGEELLVEYADTSQMTHHQRQDYLRTNYNFDCKCAVCTLPEKELANLDERLATLAQMVKQVDRDVNLAENGLEFTKLINKIMRSTEEEGIPYGLANFVHRV
jgi:L-lactate utilization protein LutB